MGDTGTVEIKRGVRLVKKHVKKDKKVEKIEKKIEDQNGENEPEAELTVKLPSKKSNAKPDLIPGAKTETEVDVLKKILADGTVEEVKTTTVKTNINGKIETESKTETRILPKEEADAAKKQAKKKQEENKVKSATETNTENGSVNENNELIVKLPSKKSGATTETKVEVENKILPDGTVEETKTTTTKTTIDGKTEVTTSVEKRILPKEEADAAIEIEEEEEEIEEEETAEEETEKKFNNTDKENVFKNEERIETTTTKKVVVTQDDANDDQESENVKQELSESEVPDEDSNLANEESVGTDEEEVEEEQEVKQKQVVKDEVVETKEVSQNNDEAFEEDEEEEEEEEEVEYEEANDNKSTTKLESKDETMSDEESIEKQTEVKDAEKHVVEDDKDEAKVDSENKELVDKDEKEVVKDEEVEEEEEEEDDEEIEQVDEIEVEKADKQPEQKPNEVELNSTNEQQESKREEPVRTIPIENIPSDENKDLLSNKPTKEPTVPLEKVEDIEIKPIGLGNETISKSKIEKTEIVMNTEKPDGPLSTQTEFNRYENIVKVNRTTKTLDNAYVQMTQNATPTMKTYFAPSREKVSPSYTPQTSGIYQPSYTSDSTTERRHSLLLERLSVERQLPSSDFYHSNHQQYNNQNQEQSSWSQEPQSEVLTESNVKPSTITNQQWYQQTKKENVIYNNVPTTPSEQWNQPQPQYQPQTSMQTQPQSPYQQPYVESTMPDYSKTNTNIYQKSNVPSFMPKSTNWGSSNIEKVENTANMYSFLNKETQKNYETPTPQFTPGYVPPPWEQDVNYGTDNNYTQNYYQAPTPSKNTYNPTSSSWKPTTPSGKFSKPVPTAYIPPAPNQSFVKPSSTAVEPPNVPGRKTYYSEYERRYITVPESTYIPGETKLQPQPDPSPKYYYDNNEPTETVEHQWRKELREFTEKTSQTQIASEQVSVKPPWEDDPKYAKTPSNLYSSTPSWSQTLRPRSWRERSFESEYVGSQEWPKASTLGRSRPVSSYVQSKPDVPVPDKPRGVSVDRFNPNSYQSPIAEHPPVQSHTLTPTTAPYAKSYHNPSIPAYHARASAEPREQPVTYQQPRMWGESRESPIQSRSFKYLQWITGTEK